MEEVIQATLQYLRALPATTQGISFRCLKLEARLAKVHPFTFTKAARKIAKADPEWNLHGRSRPPHWTMMGLSLARTKKPAHPGYTHAH